jgi:hypothetical protein
MKNYLLPLSLTLASLLMVVAACITSGPTTADTQADRQAFSAVRAYEAKKEHTPEEEAANQIFMEAWGARITADEAAAGKAQDYKSTFAELVRVYGVAIVQAELEPALLSHAPELFRLLDKDSSGHLDAQELQGFNPADPVAAAVVIQLGIRLLKHHR